MSIVAEKGAAAPKEGALAGETSPRSPMRREPELPLPDLFSKLDLNGDGELTKDEVVAGASLLTVPVANKRNIKNGSGSNRPAPCAEFMFIGTTYVIAVYGMSGERGAQSSRVPHPGAWRTPVASSEVFPL
jgi:hypothetical protein